MKTSCSAGIILCIFLLSGCGRKQRSIFHFSEKESPKISKLSLPAVKGLRATKKEYGLLLTWRDIDPSTLSTAIHFVGYHVYSVVKGRFVTKQPLTQLPITQTYFPIVINKKSNDQCYLIRAVFSHDGQKIQGPVSQIACM